MSESTENEANASNFKEITGHIEVVQQRLKTMAVGSDKYNQSVEDLSDYYERAIQDRKMRINTLEETCLEREQKHANTKKWLRLMTLVSVVLLTLFAFALFPVQFEMLFYALQPYATLDRVIVNTGIAVLAFGIARMYA